jgi:phosphate transport system substrate-binding protein
MKTMLKKVLALMQVAAVLSLGMAGAAQAEEQSYVRIQGSDTMVELVSAWAKNFMAKNPKVMVTVLGGGSGKGIASLLSGSVDIADASRTISGEEKSLAKKKGVKPVEYIVGLDGIAIVVNPSNSLKALSMGQIKKIFTGEVNNWKSFNAPEGKISVFTRDASSGTYVFFQEHIMQKVDYSVKSHRRPTNAAVVQTIADDSGSIGYIGLGYLAEAHGQVKALLVSKTDEGEAVMPSIETVKNGTYPVSRGLQMYTNGEATGSVKLFINYIMSDEAQKLVEKMGFVSNL